MLVWGSVWLVYFGLELGGIIKIFPIENGGFEATLKCQRKKKPFLSAWDYLSLYLF